MWHWSLGLPCSLSSASGYLPSRLFPCLCAVLPPPFQLLSHFPEAFQHINLAENCSPSGEFSSSLGQGVRLQRVTAIPDLMQPERVQTL